MKRNNSNMANLADTQTEIKDERTPVLSEKLRRCLKQAGTAGCTTRELSKRLYSEDSYEAQGRVVQLVNNLRRRGHKILTVKDAGFLSRITTTTKGEDARPA